LIKLLNLYKYLYCRHNTLLRLGIFILFTVFSLDIYGQQIIETQLQQTVQQAKSDSERIISLEKLSDYYYANKEFEKGDSVIEKQIMYAEATMKTDLIQEAYFNNAGYRSTSTSTIDRSKNTVNYINRALEYAKAHGFTDYVALAYANLAAVNGIDGKTEEALKYANLAFSTSTDSENDSVKVICTVQLGNIYVLKTEILTAFKTYTNANDIALRKEDGSLLPPVYHAFSLLYKKLNQTDAAKNYIFKSLEINKKNNNKRNQVNDYIALAKLTEYIEGKDYLRMAIQLADSINDIPKKIEAERILFFHMLLKESPAFMINYLDQHYGLKNVFNNTGPGYIEWILAEIYFYGGKTDSALSYFKKAEPAINSGYDLRTKKNFYEEYANCLQQRMDYSSAIKNFEKSFELSKLIVDLPGLQNVAFSLKNLYNQQGNYKKAYYYSEQYDNYKDSLEQLARGKDLALMEVKNVEKEIQRHNEFLQSELQRKYNLQYMLITIIIATAFVMIMMIGMFKVSTVTIRLMGFLSLIFFFEFIILLLDTWIHHLTHGEPWKIWLIKIGIISILLPLHHALEHRLIHYLMSRHLLTIRNKVSISKIAGKIKKILPFKKATGGVNNPEKDKIS